jgi:hypothetical protein
MTGEDLAPIIRDDGNVLRDVAIRDGMKTTDYDLRKNLKRVLEARCLFHKRAYTCAALRAAWRLESLGILVECDICSTVE